METIIGAPGANGQGDAAPAADLIKDSNTARFAGDVMDVSMATPVIVDFWAPWCEPCKQLGPMLERVVKGARGAVRMVKINVDENKQLAAQLRIQSIPAVYAFFQGQPVDGFVGAQGESEIKAFVDRLIQMGGAAADPGPSPVDQALEQAKTALDDKQHGAASALYGQILQQEPDNAEALAGLIRCHLETNDVAGARGIFDAVPEAARAAPALVSVAAALELAEAGGDSAAIPELRARLAANPDDHQARLDLALALNAAGEREAAADELLEIIRRDRAWNDEAARKQLVKFFEAWGPTDPLTLASRRRFSSLLFS
ncbi:MAG: tetratricopeptide repeat protein [Kiloniellaceae bacterium]